MSYSKFFHVEKALNDLSFITEQGQVLVVFAAFVAKKNNFTPEQSIEAVITGSDLSEPVKSSFLDSVKEWKNYSLSSFEKVPEEEMKLFLEEKILNSVYRRDTPGNEESVYDMSSDFCDLCCKLLEITPEDTLLDITPGTGTFLTYVAEKNPCKTMQGYQYIKYAWLMGNLLSYVRGVTTIELYPTTAFTAGKTYSKIIAAPFHIDEPLVENYFKDLLSLLSEDGKLLLFLGHGFSRTSLGIYVNVKKYLLDEGYLNAVIDFPARIFMFSSLMRFELLILTKNNKSARMIDSSSLFGESRRGVSPFTPEVCASIKCLLKEDNEFSKNVDYEVIRKKNYLFSPMFYLHEEKINLPGAEEYEQLSSLLESRIQRGVQIRASELEDIESGKDTGKYYLFAKDIQDNKISPKLMPINEINSRWTSLVLREGDLVLVLALTEKIKVACVENISDKEIVPASNIYIIRTDKSKLEPHYLKALLETEEANRLFTTFGGGNALRSISVDFLNRLQIPLPSMEVQKKIAERYSEIEAKREELKSQLELLTKEKASVLENLMEPSSQAF